jgi:hypothetical protein
MRWRICMMAALWLWMVPSRHSVDQSIANCPSTDNQFFFLQKFKQEIMDEH